MDPAEETPRCAHQVRVAIERDAAEPTLLCSCAAGLIHMHDCPVANGLECLHFEPVSDEPPAPLRPQDYEELHDRLMEDYLTRTYRHRVRGLAPAGDDWHRRREELEAHYGPDAEEPPPAGAMTDEDYEAERARLIEQRKKREEERRLREERSREERAKERARLGIKTVVEKAREAVDARGNVASSVVDELPAPPASRRRRRRRRKPDAERKPPAGKEPAKADAKPPRRRRRRRRRRKPPGGESSA